MAHQNPTTSNRLHAGAAQVDITPQTDIHLAGAVGSISPRSVCLRPTLC